MSNAGALTRIRSPRQWLGHLAQRHKRSQRSLAIELQRDTSQVNKWFSGKEPIPLPMFLAAAGAINSKFGEQAAAVWAAHEVASSIVTDARRQLAEVSPAVADTAAAVLLARAETSALDFGSDNDPEFYEHLCRYVLDAHAVLRLVGACQSRKTPFISRANVHDHLRFPFNVMAGDLMQNTPRRNSDAAMVHRRLSASMRSTALIEASEPRGIYCRQHSFHMLSRYGDPADVEFVRDLMSRAPDLHTKRTARYAEIINVENPAAAEEFIYELNRDRRFEEVTLDFDLVHYGDKAFNGAVLRKDLSETIANYFRRSRYRSAASQICLYKLHRILLEFGPMLFESPIMFGRVRGLLQRINDVPPETRTVTERQIIGAFQQLPGIERPKWKQMELLVSVPN